MIAARSSNSEAVGVHVDASSKIIRKVELGAMPSAIVCSNGWDDVTAALQLLSHLDGDALNVTLLVPESPRRVVPGFFDKVIIRSLQLSMTSGRIQASVSAGV